MTTTTRPSTSTEHADEARRLLSLIGPAGLNEDQFHETLAYARDPQAIAAAAQVHATLALVEEQRTANLIAADTTDLLRNPHPVGTREHDAYWKAHTDTLAERLAVQR